MFAYSIFSILWVIKRFAFRMHRQDQTEMFTKPYILMFLIYRKRLPFGAFVCKLTYQLTYQLTYLPTHLPTYPIQFAWMWKDVCCLHVYMSTGLSLFDTANGGWLTMQSFNKQLCQWLIFAYSLSVGIHTRNGIGSASFKEERMHSTHLPFKSVLISPN